MRAFKIVGSVLSGLLLALPAVAQQATSNPAIWVDRGAISSLDLINGSGGTDQPGNHFKFIKESMAGTAPKFDVEDENGVKWKVKLGPEVKAETAATRLLWAVGYFVDDDYYRPEIQVDGMQRLARGQKMVLEGGTIKDVRLERERKADEPKYWSWYDNPFSGTREFNGLKVMMAVINNWDLKEINNEVIEGHYEVADVGASFGRTGNPFTRSKGVLKDYEASRLIAKITPTDVNLVMHSRPFFLAMLFTPGNYRMRSRMERVTRHIPIADALWIGDQLGQLTQDQIRDCFRTAGFTPSEVEGYTKVVIKRIAELKKLQLPPGQTVQK